MVIVYIVTLIITLAGFIYGAKNLFLKRSPLYFKLLLYGCGCYIIGRLSLTVDIICNGAEGISFMHELALPGMFLFLLSANYGQLDSVVHDKSEDDHHAGLKALIGVAILAAMTIGSAIMLVKHGLTYEVVLLIVGMIVALPASYFNFKHLFLPMDSLEFLKGTRWCNICAILIYLCNIASNVAFGSSMLLSNILSILMAMLVAVLCVLIVLGRKKWDV